MSQHKHHDLIVAWAKGAEIQWLNGASWENVSTPGWIPQGHYRIKPEPKPDFVLYKYISDEGSTYSRSSENDCDGKGYYGGNLPNLKLTLDGETGQLKKAEVINEE